ncbi:MAG: HAD-IIB family hydrolase [Gammaproteobacteria bacterium]|nr:HAD-IIB family hydrolase [Gammaproteobacteria bacterium]
MLSKRLLVFTDLDGSLLDHHDYSHEAADPMLAELERMHVPVIPATSKTAAELLEIRKELNNHHPFIIENGAAVYIPENYFRRRPPDTTIVDKFWVKAFTQPRQYWQALLQSLNKDFEDCYTTFAQAGVEGIMELTGLEPGKAEQASMRGYSEPVSWHGTETKKEKFITQLEDHGAVVLQGGRFLHVSGNCNKGSALRWLTRQYQSDDPSRPVVTIAAGDSQNDVAMLETADIALIIRSPVNEMPLINQHQQCFFSGDFGPKGWVEGLNIVLDFLRNPGTAIS